MQSLANEAMNEPMQKKRGGMRPISEFPRADLERLQFVLCDIDDTLTHDGRLPAAAYTTLERLRSAGLKIVPVTGRPAGWCDHIARMWPVDAIVGENGAFYFRYDHGRHRMRRTYWRSADQRAADRRALNALASRILSAVPGAAVSADQSYREADLAIDFCEDVPRLPDDAVATIVRMFDGCRELIIAFAPCKRDERKGDCGGCESSHDRPTVCVAVAVVATRQK